MIRLWRRWMPAVIGVSFSLCWEVAQAIASVESNLSPFVEGAQSVNAVFGRLLAADHADCSSPIILEALFPEYEQCMNRKESAANESSPGAAVRFMTECWCEENMTSAFEALGCCGHENSSVWCDVQCDADCELLEAKSCVEACPDICFEGNLAPSSCEEPCHENDCSRYLPCIVKRVGAADGMCQVESLEAGAWSDFQECMSEHPQRTNWNFHNARHHCLCQSDLPKQTFNHNCCEEKWATSFCSTTCELTEAECESEEAQSCLEQCNEQCDLVDRQYVYADCHDICFAKNGNCTRYSMCKPVGHKEFDYVCNDGSMPETNGCCASLDGQQRRCPVLCLTGTWWYLQHGRECFCTGCPESTEEQLEILDEIYERLTSYIDAVIDLVVGNLGIPGPSEKMKDMAKSWHDELQAMWKEHDGHALALQQQLVALERKWKALLWDEATNCRQWGWAACNGHDDNHGDTATIAILGTLGGMMGCCILCCVCKSGKRRGKSNPREEIMAEPTPSGEDNLVLGRPVTSFGVEAASGAPVPTVVQARQAKNPDEPSSVVDSGVVMGQPVQARQPDPLKGHS